MWCWCSTHSWAWFKFLPTIEICILDNRFAAAPQGVRIDWDQFTRDYFLNRKTLVSVFLLIDASIPAKKMDLEYASWLGQNQVIVLLPIFQKGFFYSVSDFRFLIIFFSLVSCNSVFSLYDLLSVSSVKVKISSFWYLGFHGDVRLELGEKKVHFLVKCTSEKDIS